MFLHAIDAQTQQWNSFLRKKIKHPTKGKNVSWFGMRARYKENGERENGGKEYQSVTRKVEKNGISLSLIGR